ncbi:MAG: DUF4173 domain-containing protein [Ruminococcus sp.]|nr:DUF4173 domain-containing protein [Ruminococcus sp.]
MTNYTPPEYRPPVVGAPVVTDTPYPQPAPQQNPYVMPQAPEKPKREYSLRENIFAWLSFILAYFFWLAVPINDNPLGAFIVVLLMYIGSTIVLLVKGKKPQFMPVLVGVSAVVVSTCLIFTSSSFMHFFAFMYAMVAYCYYLYGLSGNQRFRFSDFILVDFVKALFVLPFYSFSDMFVSMFSGKGNKGGRFIVKILCGILIAVVPTLIVLSLLSYDSDFSNLMDKMFNFKNFDLMSHIVKLFLALPFGAYAYSIYISSVDKKCENILTAESCKKSMNSVRFAPAITLLTASLPVLFLYVVFFISQWKYYVSGFTGVLPKEFSYAQYAREGFFQLCTVSVINLIILIVIALFLKRKENKPSILLKVLSVVFSVFTLVLISTAVAKMVMYINCYGLTPKRVYSSWFMLVLAIVFILIIIKQFVKKLKLVALSLSVLVLMFTALSVSGVDTFIAQYNVDRYLDGSLATVDVEALEQLGDAAVVSMVKVYDVLLPMPYDEMSDTEKQLFFDLRDSLKYKGTELKDKKDFGENDIWSYTIPAIKAQKALKETSFY